MPLAAPGIFGLNTELKTQLADPRWALVLQNAVWSDAGRLTLRKGYVNQTTTALGTTPVYALEEFVQADGTVSLVAATDSGAEELRTVTVGESTDGNNQGYDNSASAFSAEDFGSISSDTLSTATITRVIYEADTDGWRVALDGNGTVPDDRFFDSVIIEYVNGATVTLSTFDAGNTGPGVGIVGDEKQWAWGSEANGWEDSQIGQVRDVTFLVDGSSVTLHVSSDDGDSWSDVSGSLESTEARWSFRNFNGDLYATAPGHRVWKYTGTGNFTQIADSPVSNGAFLSAFGRLWVGVDGTTQVKYCGLLDGDDWTSASSGTIDASNAFAAGTDNLTALGAFGATLVLFGKRQILLYVDGQGSEQAVSPDNLYVVDSIEGTGALDQDGITTIGEGDLWFRSEAGVQSLSRVVQDKANPKIDLSRNVRSLIQQLDTAETGAVGSVKLRHDNTRKLAYLVYPTSQKIAVFDTRAPLDDGTYRAAEWTGLPFFSIVVRQSGDVLFGEADGRVSKYTGYRNDGTTAFDMVYASPWTDGGDDAHNREKIVKQFYVTVFGRATLTATLRWAFDFRPLEYVAAFTSEYAASGGEFGAGEFGEAEFAEGHRSRTEKIGGAGHGQFFKAWLTLESTDVDDFLSIQEIGAYVKLGRFV